MNGDEKVKGEETVKGEEKSKDSEVEFIVLDNGKV